MRGSTLFLLAAGTLLLAMPARAEVDKKIERTWKAKCSSCHGADGKGQTDTGKKMGVKDYTTAEWQKSRTDAQLKEAILNGINREEGGKKQEMDGYQGKLDDQVDGLIALVRGLKK